MKLICPNKRQPDFNVSKVMASDEYGKILFGRYKGHKHWCYVFWDSDTGEWAQTGPIYDTKVEGLFNSDEILKQWGY